MIKIVECPRDAMQGIHTFIPTATKIDYLNQLLKIGFDTLDFGSFVSAKAIPQLIDTTEVLAGLDLSHTTTQLLAIIANVRGATEAVAHSPIQYLGYPFSISETFQQRNTNRGMNEAFEDVKQIQEICVKSGKDLVLYISMAFGNPYGDIWNTDVALEWIDKMHAEGIKIISLADTVGGAKPDDIHNLFSSLVPAYKDVELGAHFHSRPEQRVEKLAAAYEAGCQRFDSALLGFGGCPMANDSLTGNMDTEVLLSYLKSKNETISLNMVNLSKARSIATQIFNKYH